MKTSVVFFVLCCIVGAIVAEKYTTKYDNIDVEQLTRNDRLMGSYVKCLLGKGRCSRDGLVLKRVLPEALRTYCKNCSDFQKHATRTIIHYLIDKKKDWWKQLEAKFDPSGTYRKKYISELRKEKITL